MSHYVRPLLHASALALSLASCKHQERDSAQTPEQRKPRPFAGVEAVLALDTSTSGIQRGEDLTARRCGEGVALLREKFDRIGMEPWMVTVVQTGSVATQGNPLTLVARRSLMGARATIESSEQRDARVQLGFAELYRDCKAAATLSDTSAVRALAEIAAVQVKTQCPDVGSKCRAALVIMPSDFVEEGPFSDTGMAVKGEAKPIDTRGLQVTGCGLAETAGTSNLKPGKGKGKGHPSGPSVADRIAAWTAVLGVEAELRPMCPREEALKAAGTNQLAVAPTTLPR